MAHVSVVCNPRRQDPSTSTWVDGTPVFWPCQVWGPMAEHVSDSLTKGDRVMVTGRVRANTWTPSEGPNAGVEQRRLEVVVDEIGPSLRFTVTKTVKTSRATSTTEPGDDAPF